MRIYRMTATFGKLDHDTLLLEPGLNILHAPNEWGKSTWCAFLLAMLYGLDTRAKSTKATLADKERYAPWSGSPMAGRIDLCWKGRDITIERTTKGRIPMGQFRAFETKTGLPVPELTAANCGQILLGVEQNVFRRSGFIRFSDLPVTADEDLRRRLNALVTTGDESGDAERLARELRELRNRCRYNRTGLIPQAEAEANGLENKLSELESMEDHCRRLKQRLSVEKDRMQQLLNHQASLAWAAAEADADRVAQTRDAWQSALSQLEAAEASVAHLPSRQEAEQKIKAITAFREEWHRAQLEQRLSPEEPAEPELPAPFENCSLSQAEDTVGADVRRYELLQRTGPYFVFLAMAAAFLVLSAVAAVIREPVLAGIVALLGLGFLLPGLVIRKKRKSEAAALAQKYGTADADLWTARLEQYRQARKQYELTLVDYRVARGDLDARLARLDKERQSLCGSQTPEQVLPVWQQTLDQWNRYADAHREAQRWEQQLTALQAMAKVCKKPDFPDTLTYSEADTERLLADTRQELQRLQNRLGQYQGRMETLGSKEAIQKELAQVNARLKKLEDTYAALTIALETLNDARLELQRRFAPRITKRALERMQAMTGGRYDRLTLGEDFSVLAGAEREDVLQSILWRSDGTIDQLYLALRLAVAEELIPQVPLILDDALVRFDDHRLKAALKILEEEARNKQVILFTCQEREQQALQ